MRTEALRWIDISPIRLSIVVPTFNEAANIRKALGRLGGLPGSDQWEVIFVDDDSPHRTADALGPGGAGRDSGRRRMELCRDPALYLGHQNTQV